MEVAVIDSGSWTTRVGIAGEENPLTYRSITEGGKKVFGEDGFIDDFDAAESLWLHAFDEVLHVNPSETAVLFAEPSANPKVDREKTLSVMFETFGVPQLAMVNQAVLSLLSSGGRRTGLVIDLGYSGCRITPVYEFHAIHPSILTSPVGGRVLAQHLQKLLARQGTHIDSLEEVTRILENTGETVPRPPRNSGMMEAPPPAPKTYILPDGREITVGSECIMAPDVLFDPTPLGGVSTRRLANDIFSLVRGCDRDLHPIICDTMVLSGGCCSFSSMADRLTVEMDDVWQGYEFKSTFRKTQAQGPSFAAWYGGSILGSLPESHAPYVSKEEFEECGAGVVHRICY